MTKAEVSEQIGVTLKVIENITPNLDYYDIKDIPELSQYLENNKQDRVISLKEREIAILKAKDILHYCLACGYTLGNSRYNDISEIVSDGQYLQDYGDIPTIRRALNSLNEDLNIKFDFTPKLSYKMEKQLEKKKKIKEGALASISFKTGTFLLTFD